MSNKIFLKKLLAFLSVVVLVLGIFPFFACSKKMHSVPKKITDYLYEISYTDYKKDVNSETISATESFGCSSVRNGNFYGRNFDYIYNDTPEFVVKMSATAKRHASIGIATHFGLRESKMGTYDNQLDLIPNLTLDGINDCGVICSHNVVVIEEGNDITGTNPNGEDLHMLFIPRFVLDNASSADEAVDLIRSRNIVGNLNNKEYLHVMIADENKTYIVEFYKNQVLVQEKTGTEQVMTNYYLNTEEMQKYALGYERRKILQDDYVLGSTLEGMKLLMQKVKYSLHYDSEATYPWYSEEYTWDIVKGAIENEDKRKLLNADYKEKMTPLATAYWTARNNNDRRPVEKFWQTVHTSAYDIESKKLCVFVQENYANCYEFKLN